MTATERLRDMLDERGVEWSAQDRFTRDVETRWLFDASSAQFTEYEDGMTIMVISGAEWTPKQAIDATLGREQWSDPVWEKWLDGLRHDEIKTIGDAVEQLMYESIEHGGDMGPNGNTYCGIDEGEVLTLGFINDWIDKFEATLGSDGPAERGTCHITERNGSWYCEACGNEVGDSDPTSELFIDGNAVELWEFCPRCGKKRVNE